MKDLGTYVTAETQGARHAHIEAILNLGLQGAAYAPPGRLALEGLWERGVVARKRR